MTDWAMHRFTEETIVVNSETGEAHIVELDFEGAKLHLVRWSKDVIVLKITGHSYGVGHFMERGYAPAKYAVYGVLSQEGPRGGAREIKAVHIVDVPIRATAIILDGE